MNDTPELGIRLSNAPGVAGLEFKLERVRSPEPALHVPEVEPWQIQTS
jgi:hypothetical protein